MNFNQFLQNWAKVILAVYWLILFISTSIPGNWLGWTHIAKDADKFGHGAAYGILAFLLLLVRHKPGQPRPVYLVLTTLVIGLLYGFFDEWHQQFVPMRTMDYCDIMADGIGLVIGAAVWLVWNFIFERHTPDG